MPKIVSLAIHPVKSCSAIAIDEMRIGARGPLHDRQWMIVDAKSGMFLTQRQLAPMALVKTQLTEHSLILRVPGSPDQVSEITLEFSLLQTPNDRHLEVRIWNDECVAVDEGDAAAQALSRHLGIEVRLVRMHDDFKRMLPEKYGHPSAHTGFADQHPFLLVSMNSLSELNARLGDQAIPVDRFRANIVIEGLPAFAEDEWKTIRIHGIDFDVAKPCSRCMIINTDQTTAKRGVEPLKTLAGYRRDEKGKVLFGQYLIHHAEGVIRIGDEVHIVK